MARRRYLVAYDIADPKRLRRVCATMECYGERLQYSVFISDLSLAERAPRLEDEIGAIMKFSEDSVVHIDLGPTDACASIHFLGRHRTLPGAGPQIV